MPCFCSDAYNSGSLVRFTCGHVVHAYCATRHIQERLQVEGGRPSCPMCNIPGEAQGPAFLHIDETDAEHFLINNPHIFQELVNRNRAILQLQQVQRMEDCVHDLERATQTMQSALNQMQNERANNNNDNRPRNNNAPIFYEIPLYGLIMRVDNDTISFRRIQREILLAEDNDDESESDSDDEPELFEFENLALVMRIDAENITFSRVRHH